ncbi:DUF5914 domain-containing protein [Amycolatopsis magusensis]|uniref:DUF5914 domain-containing protein n=1 Tax=Amycolatopsis magusensis TaxID=882444 RepID=UPI0024A99502|nr:DUF5914 domain-containing protein [Amycolatopsis magusensis]MDI5979436.1 DUF5914 domain-containing protein [Amycolatopsis magusensis]
MRVSWPSDWPIQPIPPERWAAQRPTFADARATVIESALSRALDRPSGNWFVLAASRSIRADRPFGSMVAGRELVAWRDEDGEVRIGPGACPHLGAPLSDARLDCGALVCRWHGLKLSGEGGYGWRPLPAFDDGVLTWVRLDDVGGEPPLDRPVVPARPEAAASVEAVATLEGVCEPEDVVANRLDPWHGAWFHPYSFARLTVVEVPRDDDDRFVVDVTFRVAGRLGVPVRAEFTCPEPRTVVMRIIEGEGEGSVVETHATPRGPGPDGRPRTAVIEATVAGSSRPGFAVARKAAPVVRPLMKWTAARLWRDDLAYAERRYALRTKP